MKLFIEISKEEFAKIDKIKLEHFAITDQGKKRFFVECGINLKDIISEQLINLTELFLKHTREKQ